MGESRGEVDGVVAESMISAARLPRVSFVAHLTSCQNLDTLIFSLPRFLHL